MHTAQGSAKHCERTVRKRNLVLNELGLPPTSTARQDHVRWWYNTHNYVGQHTAATRGGHPFVYPRAPLGQFSQRFGALNPKLRCQNPFFMPFEHVERMWTIPDDDTPSRTTVASPGSVS